MFERPLPLEHNRANPTQYDRVKFDQAIQRLTDKHFKRNNSLAGHPVDLVTRLTFGGYCLLIYLIKEKPVDVGVRLRLGRQYQLMGQ